MDVEKKGQAHYVSRPALQSAVKPIDEGSNALLAWAACRTPPT